MWYSSLSVRTFCGFLSNCDGKIERIKILHRRDSTRVSFALLFTMSSALTMRMARVAIARSSKVECRTIAVSSKAFLAKQSPCVFASKRFINTNSWAADKLKEGGEAVEGGPVQDASEVTSELLSTPSPKVQKLVDEVLELNVIEVNQLIRNIQVCVLMMIVMSTPYNCIFQKRLGLSDSQMFGGGGGGGGGSASAAAEAVAAEPVKEKEHFDLKLTVVDAKAKIKIIKEIRTITGLGLKEVCLSSIWSITALIVFACL